VSGASVATIEIPIPSLARSGHAALSEILFVSLEATRMWISTHPQILTWANWVWLQAWDMLQIMTRTGWKLWAVVFVYSKTGKIKFRNSKGDTAMGFLMDLTRSTLYFIIFAMLGAQLWRVLGLVLAFARAGIWLCRAVFWTIGWALGLGNTRA
jgi:hypothetical protein